jgi:hypothetical protein
MSTDIRSAAAAAWRNQSADPDRDTALREFVGTLGERVGIDAAPGISITNGPNGPIFPRARLGLDENFAIVADRARSQRISPADVQPGPLAMLGLHALVPRLVNGADARDLPVDAQREFHITRKLIDRVGVDNLDRLWEAGSLHSAFVRTVSRVAASRSTGLDSFAQLFLHSELTLGLKDLVEVEKRLPSARDVFPMRFLNAPGAKDYEFRKIDRRGRAEHTATFEGDAPTASITSEPVRRPLVWMRSGLLYSWQDVEQWKQARANGSAVPDVVKLQQQTAREVLLELENIDLFFGNNNLKITGLFSGNQAINTPAAVANFKNAATSEAAVQLLLSGVQRVFQGRFKGPIRVLLGTRDYAYCSSATYVDGSNGSIGKSLLQVALERGKALGLEAFVHVPEVAYEAEVKTYLLDLSYSDAQATKYAGGLGGKATMVTMVASPTITQGVVGQDLMQFPPDITSTLTKIQMAASTGGLEVRQPKGLDIQIINDPT